MNKTNVKKLEKIAADYLQYRWNIYLMTKAKEEKRLGGTTTNTPDLLYYKGACGMLSAIGADWRRIYSGDDTTEAHLTPSNYVHKVLFPDDATCKMFYENACK